MKESFIINSPATLIHAHQTLIKMIEADESRPSIGALIFMGGAAPIAAADQGGQTYANDGSDPVAIKEQIAELTKAYTNLAHAHGAKLLVCGKAARSRGMNEQSDLAEGFEFTGYMEILALLNRKDEKVITW